MHSTRRRADTTGTKSSQLATSSRVAHDIVPGLGKGPNGNGMTAAVTTLAEPASSFATTLDLPLPRVDAAERIAAADALERGLRFLTHTTITVVGSRADATAAWLRRAGYQAEPLTVNGHPPTNDEQSTLEGPKSTSMVPGPIPAKCTVPIVDVAWRVLSATPMSSS